MHSMHNCVYRSAPAAWDPSLVPAGRQSAGILMTVPLIAFAGFSGLAGKAASRLRRKPAPESDVVDDFCDQTARRKSTTTARLQAMTSLPWGTLPTRLLDRSGRAPRVCQPAACSPGLFREDCWP